MHSTNRIMASKKAMIQSYIDEVGGLGFRVEGERAINDSGLATLSNTTYGKLDSVVMR